MAPPDDLAALFDRLLPPRTAPERDLDPVAIDRAEALARPLALYFRTEVEGIERLPEGGALLVSNHGPMGFDAVELVFGVYRRTRRLPRALVERTAFRVPALKLLLERLGHVAGTPDNAVALLRRGDLVLVYPGGAREAFKGSAGRYRLAWSKSTGFVRVALRAGVPIVPVAGVGVDDYYDVVAEPEEVARSPLGRLLVTLLGHEKYAPPGLRGVGPLPRPAQLTFVVGEPLRPDAPPEAADDTALVARLHADVKDRLERLLLTGLIRRAPPPPGS